VICIDGPTASGKGTLASEVAQRLGYGLLDSGALYRLVGIAAEQAGVPTDMDALQQPTLAEQLGQMARTLPVRFEGQTIWLGERNVTDDVRSEAAGMGASRVSTVPQVRQGLLDLQLRFRALPGLVADGRDMGTVIFPHAPLKVFLTASAQKRAERRHKQLISKGISANIESLLVDLVARDARDTQRSTAPLKPAEDAYLLDNSALSIEQSVQQVLAWWASAQGPKGSAGSSNSC
jgi:3-phosphoshikimate 1-carboxyvinyltransferase